MQDVATREAERARRLYQETQKENLTREQIAAKIVGTAPDADLATGAIMALEAYFCATDPDFNVIAFRRAVMNAPEIKARIKECDHPECKAARKASAEKLGLAPEMLN